MNISIDDVLGLHLKGVFKFNGNTDSEFKGPIKRGLRILFWGNTDRKATSCSFIKDAQVTIGETMEVEIVVYVPKSIDKNIQIGEDYHIGLPLKSLGIFTITEIMGEWEEKIP